MRSDTHRVTRLLDAARNGDAEAANLLLSIVYAELRRLAAGRLRRAVGAAGHALRPSDLVHEAYLRLFDPAKRSGTAWADRRRFFAAAATAMRDLIVDQARRGASLKRGGGRRRVGIDGGVDLEAEPQAGSMDLVALDGALSRLGERDARKAEVVMLRYFAGLSVEETALALEISPATVKREWAIAKALLYDDLRHAGGRMP